jgi:hypothetical protein
MDDGAPSGRDAAACAESDSVTVREDRRGRRRHAFVAGGAVTVAAVVGVVVALSGHPPRTASASAAVSAVRASQHSSAAPSLVPLSALAGNDPCLSAIATLAVLVYQLRSDFRDPSKAAADIRRTMPTIQHDMSAAPSSTLKLALADALTHLQALLADVTAGDPHAAQSSAFAQVGNDGGSISSAC